MAFIPRYYQTGCVDALFDYWGSTTTLYNNPLIDLATGAGKSPVMAMIIQEMLEIQPHFRIMVVTHVKELIEQNFLELKEMWPGAPAGIYSSGLRKKDYKSPIIFGGIGTVWNKTHLIGHIDVIMIDECHLIPPDGDTQYGQFLSKMKEINPKLRIVGMTATPYRLDFGRLDEGEDKLFDDVIYTYSIAQGVEDGYLTPLTSKATATEFGDKLFKGIRKGKDGDLSPGGLAKAVNTDELTQKVVAEIVAKGHDRRSWMMFCSGIDHANKVRDEIRSYGITCETISGDMDPGERKRILEAYKRYEIRCLCNNGVLTTGFNHAGVDLIGFLRKTLSLSLYLQMAGRGTRVVWPAGFNQHDPANTAEDRRAAIARGPKPNCLVLDFARLVDEHGPVDMVKPKGPPGSGTGEAPCKVCPTDRLDNPKVDKDRAPKFGCGEKVHASARICKECKYEFDIDTQPKLDETAADVPIMGKNAAPDDWRQVWGRDIEYNPSKSRDKPDTVKVTYKTVTGAFISEWLSPQASQIWLKQACRDWWKAHGGKSPPRSAKDFIERQGEVMDTDAIMVKPNKSGFWQVKQVRAVDPDAPDRLPGLEESETIPF